MCRGCGWSGSVKSRGGGHCQSGGGGHCQSGGGGGRGQGEKMKCMTMRHTCISKGKCQPLHSGVCKSSEYSRTLKAPEDHIKVTMQIRQ